MKQRGEGGLTSEGPETEPQMGTHSLFFGAEDGAQWVKALL